MTGTLDHQSQNNTDIIKSDAQQIADKYGVDADRVVAILVRSQITEQWNPIKGCTFIPRRLKKEARYWPPLDEALDQMGQAALDLFEDVAPDIFEQQADVAISSETA